MRPRLFNLMAILVAAVGLVPSAEAGVIRRLGRMIQDGSKHAASTTAKTGTSAAGGIKSAAGATAAAGETVKGKATGATKTSAEAVKTSAVDVKKGAEAAPRGARSAAQKVWRALW